MVCTRCGSPASMDLPPATAGPLAAHALLSGYRCTAPAGSALTWASSADAAVAADAGMVAGAAGPVAEVRGAAGVSGVSGAAGVAEPIAAAVAAVAAVAVVSVPSVAMGAMPACTYGPGSYGLCWSGGRTGNQAMVRAAPRERSSSA